MNLPDGIQSNIELADLVTLHTPACARYYLRAERLDQLKQGIAFAQEHSLPLLLLGGGSNLVIKSAFPGLVLHVAMKGVEFHPQADESCVVRAAAGETWHSLVTETVRRGYRGLENMALIPGTVGAAPVQNIGAYGAELKDCFHSLQVLDMETLTCHTLSEADCEFSYRHSLFKTNAGKRYVILSVDLRLSRTRPLQVRYGDLSKVLQKETDQLTAEDVMNAVILVRQSKLPDPAQIPNAGSFFKNPIVDCRQFESIQRSYPAVAHYPLDNGRYKLAAGWLIDQAGWRGYREGNVGVHDRQALVLVNPGCGTGTEVLALARRIQQDIFQRYGVPLEVEPVIVPGD